MFRHILIKLIVFICLSNPILGQVNENFSDGDFSSNPVWTGDTVNWKVAGFELNSNAPASASQSYIVTASSLAQSTQWEFFVDLKFATSSVNYADIFLISDSANLEGVNSGFFVKIGNTTDEISLYRKVGNTTTKIIDGTDGRVGSSSNNIFKIKVTRTLNNEFKLYDDATGTGNNYLLEGATTDASYQSSAWFGFLIKFSSANIQKFFFDDITITSFIADTVAPKLDSVWAGDSLQCILQFNEAIDTITASLLSNYTLNGTINPISAKRDVINFSRVTLLFATSFTASVLNTLKVQNVKDISGNVMNSTAKNFTYFVLQNGDLVINEIFADPSPTVGLPGYEFIELWNTSGNDLNLQGFQLTDGVSTAVFPGYILPKDSFLIVSSTSSLNAFAIFGNSIMLSNFPSLNNTGDHLQLLNKSIQVIDEVNYDLSWYNNTVKSDGGWTLELINPKLRCKKKYNWSASVNTNLGGTPGMINSIYDAGADTVAPNIASLEIINDSSTWVVFNSVMDSSSVEQMTITTSQTITVKKIINRDADSVYLVFSPLQNQAAYYFTFSKASNCNGLMMRPQSFSDIYDSSQAVQFNDVVISEVLVNPLAQSTLPNSQYIELYNRSNHSVNLKGMQISDGVSTAILPGNKLLKDHFIIIAPASKASEFSSKNIEGIFVTSFPYLNIDNDKVVLTDSTNAIINAMSYDVKSLNNPIKAKGGWSIELIDANNTCVSEGNWLYSTNVLHGTPGTENSVKGVVNDVIPLKFVRAFTIGFNEVVFIFNKSIDLNASKSQTLFEFNPLINGGFNLSYYKNNLNEVSVQFTSGTLSKDTIYKVIIKNIKDCQGRTIDSTNVLVGYPSSPLEGDIAINEILFNAKPYASEFVEFYNTSDKIFDLSTLSFTSFDKGGLSNGTILAYEFPLQLLPKQYIAIGADGNDINSRYYTPSPQNIFTNAGWKTLDDDSGVIVISDINTSNTIDSVYYSKTWHHPFIANDEGVSLERLNFNLDGKNRSNWSSAASSVGYATPAYQNSEYSSALAPDEFVSIPKTYFTPDNDGVDDELKFTIVLPSQSYSINITVFDVNGNEVKKLARNDIAAVTNYYAWNGSTTTGSLANTGHYILLIDVADANGNTKSSKQVVDLLMK